MHTQLALAMSEMPKQHQEKKGCDGLLKFKMVFSELKMGKQSMKSVQEWSVVTLQKFAVESQV